MLASFEPANSRLAKLAISTPVANSWLASLWGYHFNGRVLLLGPWRVLMNLKFTSSSFQTAWTSIRINLRCKKSHNRCHLLPLAATGCGSGFGISLSSSITGEANADGAGSGGLACPKLVRWETRPNHKSTTGDGL